MRNDTFKLSTAFTDVEQDPPNIIDVYVDLFLKLQSQMREEIVMKGEDARTTRDLDTTIFNEELYYTEAVPLLEEFAEKLIKDKRATSYVIRDIDSKKSGGIKIYMNEKIVYSVDMSLGIPLNPTMYTWHKFDDIEIMGNTIEKIMSDKVSAVLSEKRFRRAKDFYDIYILQKSEYTLDLNKFVNIFISDNGIEKSKELISKFMFSEDVLIKIEHAWGKLTLRDNNGDEINYKPNLIDIMEIISKFVSAIERCVQ